jgi:hypothetical protein
MDNGIIGFPTGFCGPNSQTEERHLIPVMEAYPAIQFQFRHHPFLKQENTHWDNFIILRNTCYTFRS